MTAPESAYMSHTAQGSIQSVRFCPYEDVLGVGSAGGYESLLIPGMCVSCYLGLHNNTRLNCNFDFESWFWFQLISVGFN